MKIAVMTVVGVDQKMLLLFLFDLKKFSNIGKLSCDVSVGIEETKLNS